MSSVAVQAAESERVRLLEAMAHVVGERGYRAASVAEVIAEAESCPATFDRHFADKQDCYLAAHRRLWDRAVAALGASVDAKRPWLERVCEGLRGAVELCIANPGLARAMVVEPAAAGVEGRRSALAAVECVAELIAPEAEQAERVPPRAALMAASGVAGLIGDQLRRGDAAGLADQIPELTFALLVPLLGPVAAGEQMGRFPGRRFTIGGDRAAEAQRASSSQENSLRIRN